MATGVPARLTAQQGRRFGLTVGSAFLVFAAIAWWRGHPTTTATLGAAGGILALAGLLIPTRLGAIERGWMRMAHLISMVTTPIVMAVMYLLVITPVGLARRAFGGNAMNPQPDGSSYWRSRPEGSRAGNLKRQF
jgi:Saxitoxin biosynthesis operon protein SxtJ